MRYSYNLLLLVFMIVGSGNNSAEESLVVPAGKITSDKITHFVRVSPRDSRYLELTDGTPYIPIGLNMISGSGRDEEEMLATMDGWMKSLSENGGNYVRIWLSAPNWDVEHETSGVYDEIKAKRIDALIEMGRKYNIREKMTLEHFRNFDGRQQWAEKSIHHVSKGGPAESISDFFTGEKSREQFKKKLDWYSNRYGDEPIVFGWELWNEINAVSGNGWMEWTEIMLPELHKRFPKNMAMQSMGSFDNGRADHRAQYRRHSLIPSNDIAQIHRYLDLGANLIICHGPVDVFAADAVREIKSYEVTKPIILAESGAVEPNHSGPFKLYRVDKDGILLHDILFAPFFAGAAGPGQIWHWDSYVDPNNLWWQFGRFAEAVKEIDPPGEGFDPIMIEHPRLRVYSLNGKKTFIAWCRDNESDWRTELELGKPPGIISGAVLDLSSAFGNIGNANVQVYDPWKNQWSTLAVTGNTITLPDFTRSIVVKVVYR